VDFKIHELGFECGGKWCCSGLEAIDLKHVNTVLMRTNHEKQFANKRDVPFR
jgi:hypothetical protein